MKYPMLKLTIVVSLRRSNSFSQFAVPPPSSSLANPLVGLLALTEGLSCSAAPTSQNRMLVRLIRIKIIFNILSSTYYIMGQFLQDGENLCWTSFLATLSRPVLYRGSASVIPFHSIQSHAHEELCVLPTKVASVLQPHQPHQPHQISQFWPNFIFLTKFHNSD